jgi:hypothetical protein
MMTLFPSNCIRTALLIKTTCPKNVATAGSAWSPKPAEILRIVFQSTRDLCAKSDQTNLGNDYTACQLGGNNVGN